MQEATRQLVAIMFTDIVGYTGLMAENERRAMDILHKNLEIQKPLVTKHGGTWLKEMGDGTLISFPTASQAVECALDIKDAVTEQADFQIRIGIHLGEIVVEKNDVFGDGVNIASRIEPLADPGQIFISSTVHFNIRNREGIRSVFVKKVKLKNVGGRVSVYSISRTADSTYFDYKKWNRQKVAMISVLLIILVVIGYNFLDRPTLEFSSTDQAKEPPSIVVLPFEDFSPNKELGYKCDGLTIDLLNTLTRLPDVRVIARTSSFAFKGVNLPVKSIADSLGVNHLIEGSISRVNDSLEIRVNLIDAVADANIWFKVYHTPFDNVLHVQPAIIQDIASKLDIYIDETKREEMLSLGTDNADAYEAFLIGNDYFDQAHRGVEIDTLLKLLSQANVYYDRAVELDPEFAAPRYRHQDLYSHMIIHHERSHWHDSLTQEIVGQQILSDLYEARAKSKRKGEALFFELEHATISGDWSNVPSILDQIESNPEYLETVSGFGAGWSKGLLVALERPGLALKLLAPKLKNDPLNYNNNRDVFVFLAASDMLDSAIQWSNKFRKETGQSWPFGIFEAMLMTANGKTESVFERISDLENPGLVNDLLAVQMGSKTEFTPPDFPVNSQRDRYYSTFIYRALNQQDKADSLAAVFDQLYFGPFGIVDAMVSSGGKIAFNLSATPNLVEQLKQAGITDIDGYQARHQTALPSSK